MNTNHRPWALHFNITDSHISLHTALSQNSLNEDEYLKWAGQYYQLPLLQKDYFQSHLQNPIELWNKVKNKAPWSSSLVPIDEWKGTIYAGCLEPPSTPPQVSNIVYILTSSQCLNSLWKSFQESALKVKKAPQPENKRPLQKTDNTSTLKPSLAGTEELEKKPIPKNEVSTFKNQEPLPLKSPQTPQASDKPHTASQDLKTDDSQNNQSPLKLKKPPEKKTVPKNEVSTFKNQEPLALKSPQTPQASDKPHTASQDLKTDDSQNNQSSFKLKKPPEIKPRSHSIENKPINLEDHSFVIEQTTAIQNAQFVFSQGVRKILNIIAPPHKQKSPKKNKLFQKPLQPHTKQEKAKNVSKKETQKHQHPPNKTPSHSKDERTLQEKNKKTAFSGASSQSEKKPPLQKIDNTSTDKSFLSVTADSQPEEKPSVQKATATEPSPVITADSQPEKKLSLQKDNTSADKSSPAMTADSQPKEKISKTKSTAQEAQISPLRLELENTKKYVSSYILFIFKSKNFIPYKWSHNLKPNKKNSVPIKQPSLFRICYHSKQPYFGWVPAVVGNQEFFDTWSFESLPEQVVFIPFLNNNKSKVLGGYLGILDDTRSSLEFLNKVSKEVEPINQMYQDESFLKKIS